MKILVLKKCVFFLFILFCLSSCFETINCFDFLQQYLVQWESKTSRLVALEVRLGETSSFFRFFKIALIS